MSRAGFMLLAIVIFGIPLAVALTDLVLTHRRGKHPVGYYINEFVIDHPFFASILALVVGAMIAHFFLNIADG
jgi:hypothetical protein